MIFTPRTYRVAVNRARDRMNNLKACAGAAVSRHGHTYATAMYKSRIFKAEHLYTLLLKRAGRYRMHV